MSEFGMADMHDGASQLNMAEMAGTFSNAIPTSTAALTGFNGT
jgi:hypothetical protein